MAEVIERGNNSSFYVLLHSVHFPLTAGYWVLTIFFLCQVKVVALQSHEPMSKISHWYKDASLYLKYLQSGTHHLYYDGNQVPTLLCFTLCCFLMRHGIMGQLTRNHSKWSGLLCQAVEEYKQSKAEDLAEIHNVQGDPWSVSPNTLPSNNNKHRLTELFGLGRTVMII